MTRIFGILVVTVGVIAGLVFAKNKWDAKVTDTARDLNAARIQREYAERVPWVRINPDPKGYKDDVASLMRWYFKEVNEHINEFGGNRNFDDYLSELKDRSAKAQKGGKIDNTEDKQATYEYTRRWFDVFKGGQYDPMYTSSDKGIRWDIVQTRPAGKKTRFEFVVWGLPREEKIVDDRKTRKMMVSANYHQNWKLFDEKNKLFGEMPVDGVDMKIDWPDRYVKWFPTQAIPGHFEIDLIPSEVKSVEITFTISTRALTGGEIVSNHTWKLDLPAEWKLRPGEKWEGAQESVRPEDEINANVKK